jgi:hypothetical protein
MGTPTPTPTTKDSAHHDIDYLEIETTSSYDCMAPEPFVMHTETIGS